MVLGRIDSVRGSAKVFALAFVRFKGFLYPPTFRRIHELEDASASGTDSRNQLAAHVLVNNVHLVPVDHIPSFPPGLDVIATSCGSCVTSIGVNE